MKLVLFLVMVTFAKANIIKHNLIENLLGGNSTYKKDEEPGILTKVKVQVDIYEIAKSDAHNTEFIFDVYLRMWWSDKRMKYSHLANYKKLELAEDKTELIWQPDVFFLTDRNPELQNRKTSNRMVYIYQDGGIVYSERTSLTLRSSFDLTYYPYDKQVCTLELQSFTYTNDSLILNWKNANPLKISGAQMTEFHITVGEIGQDDAPLLDQVGDYSTLKGIIILDRTGHAHFFQLYGPSLAVVLVSWLALFIDEKKISPRLTVHTGCIIALITQWIGIYFIIPTVSYTRAIDVWMITHQVLIVIAFLANILSLMARREDLDNARKFEASKNEENLLERLNDMTYAVKKRLCCLKLCCNCFNRFCCSCEAELESGKSSVISSNNRQAKLIEIVAIIALFIHYVSFLCVYVTCVPSHRISVNILLNVGTGGLVCSIVLVTMFLCCIGRFSRDKCEKSHQPNTSESDPNNEKDNEKRIKQELFEDEKKCYQDRIKLSTNSKYCDEKGEGRTMDFNQVQESYTDEVETKDEGDSSDGLGTDREDIPENQKQRNKGREYVKEKIHTAEVYKIGKN